MILFPKVSTFHPQSLVVEVQYSQKNPFPLSQCPRRTMNHFQSLILIPPSTSLNWLSPLWNPSPNPSIKRQRISLKKENIFFDTWAFGKGSFPWDSFFVVAAVYSRLWSLPIGGQGKYTPTFIGQVPAMWDFNKVTAEGKIDIF
jgi:hypothetical protein